MKIAINASDLDHARIDGTRIYIQNILKNFSPASCDRRDHFLIYHKNKEFNPELTFPIYPNYKIIDLNFPFWWTQTRFGWEIMRTAPDVLWMPMHSLPYLRSKKTKTTVTIHDLAFKFFPDHFPKKDLCRLNYFTDYAIKKSDKIIAVSNSTKEDILKLYPGVNEEKIKVIYHGYNKALFNTNISKDQIEQVKTKYKISFEKYLIYVGAIQPRKNIGILVDVFASLRQDSSYKDIGLVIAGDFGWLHENIVKKIQETENVTLTGKFKTSELPALLSGSEAFILPSLYEGFGMTALEAMACGTPVIAANNSSLREIIGESGLMFGANDPRELESMLREFLKNYKLKNDLRRKGLKRVNEFSWEKCAKETLAWITT
jgi:glycosyltransferase involved in cell wall biosynthesis